MGAEPVSAPRSLRMGGRAGAQSFGAMNEVDSRGRLNLRSGVIELFAYLGVGSVVTGTVRTLQVGYALQAFERTSLIAGLIEVMVLRASAAHLAATSVGVALVVWAHRSGPGGDLGRWWGRLGTPLAVVPVAALAASQVTLFASLGTAVAVYGLTPRAFAAELLRMFWPSDAVFGLAKAGLYGAVLGVAATLAAPWMARARMRLGLKLVVGWIALGTIVGVLDAAIDPRDAGDSTVPDPIEVPGR